MPDSLAADEDDRTADELDESGEVEPEEIDDFLAFLAEQDPTEVEVTTIYGVKVEIPRDVPLLFNQKLIALDAGQADDDTVRELVEILFGSDIYNGWVLAGMTDRQFAIIFTWGMANAKGKRTTFAEAKKMLEESEAEERPTNRAERRAAVRPRGSATGRSSKPTSRANTSSPRRSSRG